MKRFALRLVLILALMTYAQAEPVIPAEDVGVVKVGQEVIRDFPLQNASGQTVAIGKVSADCSCTTIVSYPKELKAGEKGVVKVKFTPDKAAKYDVLIAVQSDKQSIFQTFRLRAVASVQWDSTKIAQYRVSPTALQEEIKNGSVALVDVRASELYVESHLPGAIQLPLHSLRAMQTWKKRNVVIIDDVGGTPTLFMTIDLLRKEGFGSVRVLESGIRGWQLAGGKLEGTNPNGAALATIPVETFTQVSKDKGWLVIDASMAKTPLKFSDGIQVKRVDTRDPKVMATVIQTEVTKTKPQAVLVVNDNSGGYAQLDPLMLKNPVPVYYLAGGREEWGRMQKQQQLIASGHKVTIESGMAHGSGSGTIKSGAGCGGCGK